MPRYGLRARANALATALLFSGGDSGFPLGDYFADYLDPAQTSTLNEDTAGTGDIPSNSDVVGRWETAVSSVAFTESTNKPRWYESGTNSQPYVSFDNVDDKLQGSSDFGIGGTGARELWLVASLSANGNFQDFWEWSGATSAKGRNWIVSGGVYINTLGGSNIDYDTAFGTSTTKVLRIHNAASATIDEIVAELNGTALGVTSADTEAVNLNINKAIINDGSAGVDLYFAGWAAREFSASEVTALEAHFAERFGVSFS